MATFLVRAGALRLLEDPFEVLKRMDGAVLSVGANQGFDPADVEMVQVDGLLDDIEGLVPGSGVWLDTDVDFESAFLLTLDMPPPPDEDAIPLVFHFGDDGEVDVRVGLWDEEASTVTVAVDEFSINVPGWGGLKKAGNTIQGGLIKGTNFTINAGKKN